MKASTKRALSILMATFFLIATVVVYTNLIRPEIQNVNQLRGVVASKNNVYLTQKNAISQVSKIISQFNNASDLQKTLSFSMPIGASIPEALNQWYGISQNSQANVQSLDIKVNNPAKRSNQPLLKEMGVINVTLGLVGTYDALKQFLNFLETNVRIINVTNLQFQKGAGTVNNNPLFSLNLNVETYYQAQ